MILRDDEIIEIKDKGRTYYVHRRTYTQLRIKLLKRIGGVIGCCDEHQKMLFNKFVNEQWEKEHKARAG